jgi:pimeloyl-ACP methyl ester carboxylesterase
MSPTGPAEHITPYDRIALDEAVMVALLAAPARHEGLVDYFGAELHAELVALARATARQPARPGPRVYLLPGIMGSQIGYERGGGRPHDVVWLDPIDINFGRLGELRLPGDGQIRALGAMSYTYLKLTLSLRKAGFDTVLVSYDWRQDLATLGQALAERMAADACEDIALVGHSMGGLVARAAMTHPVGKSVSRLVMLGTPNHGSLAAVQALRGTYSVVRKLAQMDLRHDAEFLASEIFSTFAGLHELLPTGPGAGRIDLFDRANWPKHGPGPDARLLHAASSLSQRLAPADARFHAVVGCNRITATRLSSRDGDFEYEYSLRGDGTVPMALARLPGARHRYVDCDHSDMPLSDRIIAGTIDLLRTGTTRRFAAAPRLRHLRRTRVRDAELRREYVGKVDWPQMSPAVRRLFLDTLNEPPRRMRGSVSPLKNPRRKQRAAPKRRKAARKK